MGKAERETKRIALLMQNTGLSVAVVVVVVGDDRREGTGFLICKVIRQLLPRHSEEWCRPSLLCLLCRSHNVDDGPERLFATHNRLRQRAVA